MQEFELAIRRLRYRLNRQGMLELDAWLAGLMRADLHSAGIVDAIESILACEPPELQAMMHDESLLPEVLRPWLACD